MPPTGSKDPFALRRAALGVIQIVTENGLRLPIADGDLLDFFADRLKVQQREAGVRHDLIDAVFALGNEDDLVRLLARVSALQSFVEGGEGANLLAGYKRAANILKKENWDLPRVMADRGEQGMPQTGEEDPLVLVDEEPELARAILEQAQGSAMPEDAPEAERALVAALDVAEPGARTAVEAEDFRAAMAALASLRGPIDAFFETVTVNDPVPEVRRRRLNILARFRDAVHGVADFSRIEG
jgi:glycyl-tRNA synthetase beta chain